MQLSAPRRATWTNAIALSRRCTSLTSGLTNRPPLRTQRRCSGRKLAWANRSVAGDSHAAAERLRGDATLPAASWRLARGVAPLGPVTRPIGETAYGIAPTVPSWSSVRIRNVGRPSLFMDTLSNAPTGRAPRRHALARADEPRPAVLHHTRHLRPHGEPQPPRPLPLCYRADSSRRNAKARANGTKSAAWARLRQQRIQMDAGRCTFQLSGCTGGAETSTLPRSSAATTTRPRSTTPALHAGIARRPRRAPLATSLPASGTKGENRHRCRRCRSAARAARAAPDSLRSLRLAFHDPQGSGDSRTQCPQTFAVSCTTRTQLPNLRRGGVDAGSLLLAAISRLTIPSRRPPARSVKAGPRASASRSRCQSSLSLSPLPSFFFFSLPSSRLSSSPSPSASSSTVSTGSLCERSPGTVVVGPRPASSAPQAASDSPRTASSRTRNPIVDRLIDPIVPPNSGYGKACPAKGIRGTSTPEGGPADPGTPSREKKFGSGKKIG